MLPGVGFSEILVLGVIALLVVGPKDLPLMLRKLGQQMARLRALANEFRSGFDELARQAELDELKREVEALRRGQYLGDPVLTDIERKMTEAAAPPTEAHLTEALPAPEGPVLEAAPPVTPVGASPDVSEFPGTEPGESAVSEPAKAAR